MPLNRDHGHGYHYSKSGYSKIQFLFFQYLYCSSSSVVVSEGIFLRLSITSLHANETIRPLTEIIELLLVGIRQGPGKYRNFH